MDQTIVIVAEHFRGELKPVTYDLMAFAAELQQLHPAAVKVVILGDRITELARKTARETDLDVIGIQDPNLTSYNGDTYKAILGELLPELRTAYVCAAHTTQGGDFAPALAVRLGAACITGVERVFEEDGRICFTRAIYNGKIMANLSPSTGPVVVTVQPGMFKPPSFDHTTPGVVEIRTVSHPPQRTRSMGINRVKQEDSALVEAEIIVSAGRGIGKKEKLGLISRFAALFPRSALGGSRPVCDLDWLEYKQQIGLTGATVTPRLYIACGISGSVQHLSGMRGAGFIVAINTDPDAAIFNIADVCIVDDLTTFIPTFIEEYERQKRSF